MKAEGHPERGCSQPPKASVQVRASNLNAYIHCVIYCVLFIDVLIYRSLINIFIFVYLFIYYQVLELRDAGNPDSQRTAPSESAPIIGVLNEDESS